MHVDPAILARVRRADRLVGSYRGRDRVKASTLERDAQKGVSA